MTTKIISGYYNGYTVASGVTQLSITASGYIGGNGLSAPTATSIANAGTIFGAYEGVSLSAGGSITNGASGSAGGVIYGYAYGVKATGAAAAVNNFGMIEGGQGYYGASGGVGGIGVALGAGGTVANSGEVEGGQGGGSYNGTAGAGGAGVVLSGTGVVANAGTIAGGLGGNAYYGAYPTGDGGAGGTAVRLAAAGTVSNQGLIQGGQGGYAAYGNGGTGGDGVALAAGGAVINQGVVLGGQGGYAYAGNGGDGGVGVRATAGGTIANNGTIGGGQGGAPAVSGYNYGAQGLGVLLTAGGGVTNGDSTHPGALIYGSVGVYVTGAAATTVTNFGTIQGSVDSVILSSSKDVLVAAAGAIFDGAIVGGGGQLALASGSETITGLSGLGTITGAVTATFGGFGSLLIGKSAMATFSGANEFNAGVALINGGTATIAGTLRVNSAIDNTGTIVLAAGGSPSNLVIGANTALVGGGTVALGSGTANRIYGVSAATVLTNADNTLTGSGSIGLGRLTLVNGAKGVIDANGSTALVVNTGTNTIANAGTIEAAGAGGAIIQSAVNNTGVLEVAGGVLTVTGAVSGGGSGVIAGGTLDFTSTFAEAVKFTGTSGVLELAHAQSYTGAISGFSKTGGTSLDLRDIAFKSAGEATFSGTATSGVLTVTDGTHTAKITLIGDYLGSVFTTKSDGHGGVIVVDPQAQAATTSAHAFVAAMAGLGAGMAAATSASHEPRREHSTLLATPRL